MHYCYHLTSYKFGSHFSFRINIPANIIWCRYVGLLNLYKLKWISLKLIGSFQQNQPCLNVQLISLFSFLRVRSNLRSYNDLFCLFVTSWPSIVQLGDVVAFNKFVTLSFENLIDTLILMGIILGEYILMLIYYLHQTLILKI